MCEQGCIGVVEDDQFLDVWAICLWFKWFGFDFILCSNEVWILDRILHILCSNDAPFSVLAMATFKVDVPQWQSSSQRLDLCYSFCQWHWLLGPGGAMYGYDMVRGEFCFRAMAWP